ncbi:MAG: large subunit ribosomal protein L6 [Parcubacteria group bacterium Gr01-1014_3]|nr:MAG: large subunit ribosomal protein L6 [Parcubacteria group bacterium Gr01-1014_3]
MSKIGKKPIVIPEGVEVKLGQKDDVAVLDFKGKEGSLSIPVLEHTKIEIKEKELAVTTESTNKYGRSNWGTMAALIKNAIEGVSKGFTKTLDIEGIGFKASLDGNNLVLNVGFSHPVKYTTPAGIKIVVEKSSIKVSGIDRALVGQVAAQIRKVKEPEPYQGKGIRYRGEVVRRKAGKKVAGAGTAAGAAK